MSETVPPINLQRAIFEAVCIARDSDFHKLLMKKLFPVPAYVISVADLSRVLR